MILMQALKNRLRAVFCCPCKQQITMHITAADPDTFKRSQPQIMADLQRMLNRGRDI
jgi:hypothetical protein